MKGRAAYTHSPKQKLEVAEKSSLSFGRISPLFVHSLNSTASLLKIQYGTILTKKSYELGNSRNARERSFCISRLRD